MHNLNKLMILSQSVSNMTISGILQTYGGNFWSNIPIFLNGFQFIDMNQHLIQHYGLIIQTVGST